MAKKLYFESEESEQCFDEEYFQDLMRYSSLNEIEVFKAVKYKEPACYWCNRIGTWGLKSDKDCGKICINYSPRNGKSGCCKYYSNVFYEWGDKVVLKLITKTPC